MSGSYLFQSFEPENPIFVAVFHRVDLDRFKETITGLGSIGPAPRIGESVELRLAYLSARLAKEDIVIGVRVEWRIEIDQIDTRVGKFFPLGKPFQIVAEIQAVHRFTFLPDIAVSVQSTRR